MTVDSIAFGETPGEAPWCRLKPTLLLEQNVLGKNAVLSSLHVFCFCSPHRLIAMATRLVLRVLGCPAISSYRKPRMQNAATAAFRTPPVKLPALPLSASGGSPAAAIQRRGPGAGKWDVKSVKNVKRLRGPFLGIEREKEPPEPFDTFDAPVQTQTENPRKA